MLEIVIITGIILVLAAIAVPTYLDYTTRSKTTEPMLAFDTTREQVLIEVGSSDKLLQCEKSMINKGNFSDSYMNFNIHPVDSDINNSSSGYGAGLFVVSELDKHEVEGVQVTKEFYHELKSRQPEKMMPDKATMFYLLLLVKELFV
ncbi:MAG: hypothetical protein GKR93_04505 [Gammaproteobacteria bacterium]|nr:hypothetical protein [Gammaproteobacteria bacterium]